METEKALVEKYVALRKKKKELKAETSEVEKRIEEACYELIEHLESVGAESTSKYTGIGFVSLTKPKVRASLKNADFDQFKSFLLASGREDLIRETIHPSTLASWAKEQLENGAEIPDCINVYLEPQVKLYRG